MKLPNYPTGKRWALEIGVRYTQDMDGKCKEILGDPILSHGWKCSVFCFLKPNEECEGVIL